MAPECVRNKDAVSRAIDVWSLGCILYQLLSGLLPFRGASDYLIFRRSTESRYRDDLAVLPKLARDLIAKCLQIDPTKRPSIDELLADPYFSTDAEKIATRPELLEWEQLLRKAADNYIQKSNVYRFDGIEKLKQELALLRALVKDADSTADDQMLDHFEQLAVFYLFDHDPDASDLEEEKNRVQEESRKAQIENAKRMEENERKLRGNEPC